MKWLVVVLLAAAPAAAEERKVVVTTIEGVLPRAEAAALEDAVRTEARAAGRGFAGDGAARVAGAGAWRCVRGYCRGCAARGRPGRVARAGENRWRRSPT